MGWRVPAPVDWRDVSCEEAVAFICAWSYLGDLAYPPSRRERGQWHDPRWLAAEAAAMATRAEAYDPPLTTRQRTDIKRWIEVYGRLAEHPAGVGDVDLVDIFTLGVLGAIERMGVRERRRVPDADIVERREYFISQVGALTVSEMRPPGWLTASRAHIDLLGRALVDRASVSPAEYADAADTMRVFARYCIEHGGADAWAAERARSIDLLEALASDAMPVVAFRPPGVDIVPHMTNMRAVGRHLLARHPGTPLVEVGSRFGSRGRKTR